MSEIDERRIAELAKQPPCVLRGGARWASRGEAHEPSQRRIVELVNEPSHVLPGGAGPAALEEARKVLEALALMRRRIPGENEGDSRC